MTEDPKSWLLWLAGPAIPGVLTAIGAWYWQHRKDVNDREDRHDTREDREQAQIAGQRDRLTADLRVDLDTCRGMLEATSRDRYRGWDLARRHYEQSYQYRIGWLAANSAAREARQIADSLARKVPPEDAPSWGMPLDGPPPMPPFDEAKPASDK